MIALLGPDGGDPRRCLPPRKLGPSESRRRSWHKVQRLQRDDEMMLGEQGVVELGSQTGCTIFGVHAKYVGSRAPSIFESDGL